MAEPVKSPWMSAQRTAGQTRWQSVVTLSNVVTRKVSYRTNSFVELGAGLNVPDTKGQFIAANPSFTITPTGAEARGAAHQVIVPGDIGSGVGVRIITPKGDALVFQPLAVDYFDPVDGRGVLLDTVTNAIGWLVASNEIIFSNCFTHLKASIRLRNTRAGLESDLILHERPPDPEAFGLSSFARLEMLTEQLEGVAPTRRATVLRGESNPAVRADMVEPDFVDTELGFNGMKMAVGKAFITPTPTNAAATPMLPTRVGKTFLNLEGRNILIEAVEHRKVREALNRLPLTTNSPQLRAGMSPVAPVGRLAVRTRALPVLARASRPADTAIQEARLVFSPGFSAEPDQKPLLASAAPAPAFVLDYYLLNEGGENNFTFRGDTTYLVSTFLLLTGTTTLEGGTVVKFNEGAGLIMFAGDSLLCDTTNHLPAVFTCFNDNSVGENIGGSGAVVQVGAYAFYFVGGTRELNNVRFTHLSHPIAVEGSGIPSQITLRNVQVVNAAYALETGNTTMQVFNGLFKNCGIVFSGGGPAGNFLGEHLTVHNTTANPTTLGYATSATLRNSLLVAVQNAVGNIGSYIEVATDKPPSASGIFQAVEGGGYYLTNNAYRNTGTTDIDAQLKAVLTNMTTYAPEVLTGTMTTDRTLTARAIRDTDGLDRGYHYPAVDYLAKNLTVQNATLKMQNGVMVAGGFNSSQPSFPALQLAPGKLISLGTATRLNHLIRASQVQENVQGRGYELLQDGPLGTFKPEVTVRFTEISSLAGEWYNIFLYWDVRTVEFTHSTFSSGLVMNLYGGALQNVGLTNNLFRRTFLSVNCNSSAKFNAYNNLLKDSALSLHGDTVAWQIFDNVFDNTTITEQVDQFGNKIVYDNNPGAMGYNAFVGTNHQLSTLNSSFFATNLAYASGPLGRYYVSGTTLQDAGSRTAGNAGLYHFTTQTNQVKEANSPVDIGLHYVAMGTGNVPNDTDGDGVVDYAEDANGNGTQDVGETSLTRQDSPFLPRDYEPLGPSSRRTPLVISEIMYHPASGQQFIELYNSHHLTQDLSGFTFFIKSIRLPYPLENTLISPSSFLSVPFGFLLNTNGDTVQLLNRAGAVLLEVAFKKEPPWPKEADRAGHSLVLARPSYGENDPRAWAASEQRGGSSGYAETNRFDFLRAIRINEFLAFGTNTNDLDFIELYNASNQAIDLSGCTLSEAATNLTKFVIPAGTVIEPRGFKLYRRNESGSFTFNLKETGDQIYLTSPSQGRVIDVVDFKTQEAGVSAGQVPDGSPNIVALSSRTPGASNSPALARSIVINEIMYHPISENDDDEFVELYNAGTNSVNLDKWTLGGAVLLTITNFTLAPSKYLVLALQPTLLASKYPTNQLVISSNLFKREWTKKLGDGGDRITLNSSNGVIMDEVIYSDGGRWGRRSDGDGSSLELIDPRSDNRLAANWADSDETGKATNWVLVSYTNTIDHVMSVPNLNRLEITLQGPGECLVDNIEVWQNGTQFMNNTSFDTAGLTDWQMYGTHSTSSLETTNGYNSSKSLHLRAVGRGDTLDNYARGKMANSVASNVTASIQARVRWLSGNRDILFRLLGNALEAAGTIPVPSNLGTPGKANSRFKTNSGPAISEVSHFPLVPLANELVLVTARVHDPDGVSSFVLKYRVDPSATTTSVTMRDDGASGDALAGDGLFTGVIPGQNAGKMVAFHLHGSDAHTASTTNRFPAAAPTRECLVRFGDPQPIGGLTTYRIWMTEAVLADWKTRSSINNSPFDITFVYGNDRVVYNTEALYSGSSFTSVNYNGPTNRLCSYELMMPPDDTVLGAKDFALEFPVQDTSAQREQLSFWLAGQLGLPNNHRRFIHIAVNGMLEGMRPAYSLNVSNEPISANIYEDAQQVNSDLIAEWLPGSTNGNLYKIEVAKENTTTPLVNYINATLEDFQTTGGVKKTARYRWNWRKRAANGSAHDFADLFALVDAVNATSNYTAQVEAQIQVEQWMRVFAFERIIANDDTYGYTRGHNLYAYKPDAGLWQFFLWDLDVALGAYGLSADEGLFVNNSDPMLVQMVAYPPFRRMFWRTIQDAVNGPFQPAVMGAVAEANYAFLTQHYSVSTPQAASLLSPDGGKTNVPALRQWITNRYSFLTGQLATVAAPFEISNNGGNNFAVTQQTGITLAGKAPVEAAFLRINGAGTNANVTWASVTNWSLGAELPLGTNTLTVEGFDRLNQALGGFSDTIIITNKP